MFPGHCVGETVAQVETGRVYATAPLRVRIANSAGGGCRERDDGEVQFIQQPENFVRAVAAPGDDQQLSKGASRHELFAVGTESRKTRIGGRFIEQERHDR